MSKSNSSVQTVSIPVTITAGDPLTEIFVLDSYFRVVVRGIGRLQTSLHPGLYKVKLQSSNTIHEEILMVERASQPLALDYDPLTIVSAAPLDHSSKHVARHQHFADTFSKHTFLTLGRGSWIFLFARETGPTQKGAPPAHPAEGLTLHNATGELLVDYATSTTHINDDGPCAGCNVEVTPGIYHLRLTLPNGNHVEQSIVASPGWQTQVFLVQADLPTQPDSVRRANLATATILLSKRHQFEGSDQEMRQAEVARLALVNGRSVVSDELRQMIHGKFQNPMLGIFVAHLLLRDKNTGTTFDRDLFVTIVRNMRNLLRDPHPDLEALALTEPDLANFDYRFEQPPMLARSWRLILQATVNHAALVPEGSLSAHIASHRWGLEPWLLWQGQATSLEGIARSSASAVEMSAALPADGSGGSIEEAIDEAVKEFFARRHSGANPARALGLLDTSATILPARDDETIGALVTMLGIPRGEVERVLNKLYQK